LSDSLEAFESEAHRLLDHQDGHSVRVTPAHLPDSVAALVCTGTHEILILVDVEKPLAEEHARLLMREYANVPFYYPSGVSPGSNGIA
jgi:Mor family transcriptional regulator